MAAFNSSLSAALEAHGVAHDARALRKIAGWIALSLALHAALLAWDPRWRVREQPEPPSITVFLRDAPPEPGLPEITLPPLPAPKRMPRAAEKPIPRALETPAPPRALAKREPVIALDKPKAVAPPAPTTEPPVTTPAPTPPQTATPAPMEGDFAAFVEARRRARGDGAENIAAGAAIKPAVPIAIESKRPTANSGWFRIDRKGVDYAEYMFFGWNENFRANGLQMIDVRKGDNPDINIAIIRSVISVIRRYENGDFPWYSKRLGRTLILSARARDNAGLEEFMMREFHDDLHGLR